MSGLTAHLHPLLTTDIISTLHNQQRINTITKFLDSDIKIITTNTSLTYKQVLIIRKHLINKHSAPFRNGLSYYKDLLSKTAIISTGMANLDKLLGGGLITGNHYELCGLPCSGKTQLCLTICKNVGKQSDQTICYLNTKGDFSATRLKGMMECEKFSQIEMAQVLEKILVKSISSKYELTHALYSICTEDANIRLIIIDSLPVMFYNSYDNVEISSILNQLANVIRFLCKEYHIIVFTTNLLTNWVEGDFREEANVLEKVGLGKFWLTVPNVRLTVKPTQQNQFQVSIVNSFNSSRDTECKLSLSHSGLQE